MDRLFAAGIEKLHMKLHFRRALAVGDIQNNEEREVNSTISRFINRWRAPEAVAQRVAEYAPAPGTGIRFSPGLTDEFIQEHKRFFTLHSTILSAHERGDLAAIPPLLSEFEAILTGHFLTERVRLYAYMDAYFSTDRKTHEMLREYRTEMDRIGDSVMVLIRKYRNIDSDVSLRQEFGDDFQELGKVLTERMQREEAILYPLYMPVST